jgi:hypothetical protein
MATIDDAVKAHALELHPLPEWETRPAVRPLWIACGFWTEFDAVPELHDMSYAEGGRSLAEHIQQIFCDFRCSKRPSAGDLKRMRPTSKGVWKLHPAAVRVYGWCPKPQSFVAVTLALKTATLADQKLSNVKRDQVSTFIKTNKLQSFVLRGDINAVFPPSA